MTKRTFLIVSFVFLIILVSVNIVYYENTKRVLINEQEKKMSSIANDLKISIDLSTQGENILEEQIGIHLRDAAIAAELKLNPDINKVDNHELVELSKLLGVDDITLFVKTKDDIVGVKSSDPKEINVSSKSWGSYFTVMNQLFDKHNTDEMKGQVLPNFWSGPYDTSATNHDNVDKWGYYYDGGTNYIIDPYVHNSTFRIFQNQTGINATIANFLIYKATEINEISVLNTDILIHGKPAEATANDDFSTRLVLFGNYKQRDPDEIKHTEEVVRTKENVFYLANINNKTILKGIIPLTKVSNSVFPDANLPVIEIAADYAQIQAVLNKQLYNLSITIIVCSVFSLAIIFLIMRVINRKKNVAVQIVQELFVGNVDSLFHSMREQRHDFNNHVSVINSLIHFKKYDELEEYTKDIIGEVLVLNDIININVPAISALIQVKVAEAVEKRITFKHDIANLGNIELETLKATDLVKILANLIDNAYDATNTSTERLVKLSSRIENTKLVFEIYNSGSEIPDEILKKIFISGFTTKADSQGHGLGLSIVKNLVNQYRGTITATSNSMGTTFKLIIPV